MCCGMSSCVSNSATFLNGSGGLFRHTYNSGTSQRGAFQHTAQGVRHSRVVRCATPGRVHAA
jgi:hypothetical protein